MSSPLALHAPDGSKQFSFACACLNARVICRISSGSSIPSSPKEASGTRIVHLGEKPEALKQGAYVTWDQVEVRSSRRPSVIQDGESERLGPSWRTCWLCKTRLYQDDQRKRESPSSTNTNVTIDLSSGIVWGEKLEELSEGELLPFSSIALPASGSSSFGKPPPDPLNIYPRVSTPTQSKRMHYIPPLPDPFFLPPPFIPSHPHLRNLCGQSIEYLKDRHNRLEAEVQEFIAQKSNEMRRLEDSVRNEVETLWEKYKEVPGIAADLERSRSRSVTREESKETRREVGGRFTPTPSTTPKAGILAQATSPTPAGSSLLSASISANSFHAPPPRPAKDQVDHSILEASKRYDTKSDARAVAMSYVFSSLDEAMVQKGIKKRSTSIQAEDKPAVDGDGKVGTDGDKASKDSWIHDERRVLAEEDVGTPKSRRPELGEGKRAVKFIEPESDSRSVSPDPDDRSAAGQEEDDYVFDFEVEESDPSNEVPAPHRDISRTRDMIEANLSTTFAADAPSHRAAWRVQGVTSSLWAIPKNRTDSDDGLASEDEGAISKLAQSMPMNIALKQSAKTNRTLPAMERKTSWSDRQELVPPLRAAMRQQGVSPTTGSSPGNTARRTNRNASVSRERDGKSYQQDPGAVFESLADEAGEDEEEDEQGTLRESGFVPPHVAARRQSNGDGPEVGWRSLVN